MGAAAGSLLIPPVVSMASGPLLCVRQNSSLRLDYSSCVATMRSSLACALSICVGDGLLLANLGIARETGRVEQITSEPTVECSDGKEMRDKLLLSYCCPHPNGYAFMRS